MLQVEHLTVRYGAQAVVSDVSFTLHPGQWLMLTGPNGAGKSSVINTIGQGVPYTGRITLDGTDLRSLRPAQRAQSIGILSQTHPMGYDDTVEEVVRLGRYAHRRGFLSHRDEDGEACVNAALRQTGMDALRRQSMLALSGGEVQRAFLAQVFAQNPRLLILDEPANHLDLVYQKQLFSLIGQWLRTPGRAVLSVVHDLSLARRFGTHALLLDRGLCAAQGEIRDVFDPGMLQAVYGMDVHAWMRSLLEGWQT